MPKLSGEIHVTELRQLIADKNSAPAKGGNKYGAQRVVNAQGSFDSKHEASWVSRLMVFQQKGMIERLRVEKRDLMFALDVNGTRIADYEADARFTCVESFDMPTFDGAVQLIPGQDYVIDAKSIITRKKAEYRMKKSLVWAIHGVKILEV